MGLVCGTCLVGSDKLGANKLNSALIYVLTQAKTLAQMQAQYVTVMLIACVSMPPVLSSAVTVTS